MGDADQDGEPRLHPEPERPSPLPPEDDGVAPDPVPGERIAEYELLELLGRGGAGSVFRVRRSPDGAMLALKVLAASKVRRARTVQRFFDEVRAASAVTHPGLVRVVDFIEQEQPRRLAYAMEYVPGEVLRAKMKREGLLDLRLAIQVGVQICRALEALHRVGIIHRDLKPENILLGDAGAKNPPVVKLFDFGVVKFLPVDRTAETASERPGTFVGTPRYMAPEQAAGSGVDHRADLFALGVMLFEMITGRCPHEGDSLRDVVMAKLEGAPRITVNPEQEILPQELTDIVDRCLKLKPGARPKDAAEVAGALLEAEVVLLTVGTMRATAEGIAIRHEARLPSGVGARLDESSMGSTPATLLGGIGPGTSRPGGKNPPVAPAGPPPAAPITAPNRLGLGLRPWTTAAIVVLSAVALAAVARWLGPREPVVVFEEPGPAATSTRAAAVGSD